MRHALFVPLVLALVGAIAASRFSRSTASSARTRAHSTSAWWRPARITRQVTLQNQAARRSSSPRLAGGRDAGLWHGNPPEDRAGGSAQLDVVFTGSLTEGVSPPADHRLGRGDAPTLEIRSPPLSECAARCGVVECGDRRRVIDAGSTPVSSMRNRRRSHRCGNRRRSHRRGVVDAGIDAGVIDAGSTPESSTRASTPVHRRGRGVGRTRRRLGPHLRTARHRRVQCWATTTSSRRVDAGGFSPRR